MKEKIIKTILENTDEDLRVTDLIGLAKAIEKLYGGYHHISVDWSKVDEYKWSKEDLQKLTDEGWVFYDGENSEREI